MIQAKQLTRVYGRIRAVDGISFTVEPGEVLGFLGPNGAGKSTTMKMLAGFLVPTSGAASICGHDVQSDPLAAKRHVGYLPEGAPSYGEMDVLGFLSFVADVRGLAGEQRRRRLGSVVERLALGGVLAQPVDTLSKGFRRRVGLAAAILHDPRVLILDEPTDGLDPNQKHEVRGLIRDMSRERTIIVSTHILEEVDAVCTRAVIIAQGRLLVDDTPEALAKRSRYHGAVTFRSPDSVTARVALEGLDGVERVESAKGSDRLVAIPREGASILDAVSLRLRERGVACSELQLERGRLDEVFRSITLGGESGAGAGKGGRA